MAQEALDAETVQRFAEATERTLLLQERLGVTNNENKNQMRVSVEGSGGLATGLTMGFILGFALALGFWATREFNRIDTQLAEQRAEDSTLRTYLSSIWQQAPHLKPKEEQEKEDAAR